MWILNKKMITVCQSLLLGLSLLLFLNACGDSGGGSFTFDKRGRGGSSPRNALSEQDQRHIDGLINKMPPTSYLQSFYTANKDDISIHLSNGSQSNTQPNSNGSQDSSILSLEEFTSETNTDLALQLDEGNLKCLIEINRDLDENTQTHLLAHQLKKCEVENTIYTALVEHEDFNDVEEFYQIRTSLAAEDPANPLISLVRDLYAYSVWEAYEVNQVLQAQNVPFNHSFGLNNIQGLVEAELSTIDIFAADLGSYDMPHPNLVTIQSLINNFVNLPSSNAQLEIPQNQPPIVGWTGGGLPGQ